MAGSSTRISRDKAKSLATEGLVDELLHQKEWNEQQENPNWYAAKATAKEMWEDKSFVPYKKKAFSKLREMGVPEKVTDTVDDLTPDNPTQAAATYLGGKLASKAAKGLYRAIKAPPAELEELEQGFSRMVQEAPKQIEKAGKRAAELADKKLQFKSGREIVKKRAKEYLEED